MRKKYKKAPQIEVEILSDPYVVASAHIAPPPARKSTLPNNREITTPKGWIEAVRRYMNELSNQEFARSVNPLMGDVVVETTRLPSTAPTAPPITPDQITVGTLISVKRDPAMGDLHLIRLSNGDTEQWGNARFFKLSPELLLIYQMFILVE